jgi:hypothetical protein
MLRSLKDLERYKVGATDGDVGRVVNFLLDDERWAIRYLVVETGSFFNERQVLISPISFREVDWSTQLFHLALTKDRIKNSPSVDVEKPVSRQHERDYYGYYGYPYYWGYAGLWGTDEFPGLLGAGTSNGSLVVPATEVGERHLRSANEVRGYHVQGSDEAIGHIADFIVDDNTWAIRYLVIDTSNWWFGKEVLIAPHWANRVSWEEQMVYVEMSRQAIKDSPEWNAAAGINRQYETVLYDYYGRPAYWDSTGQSLLSPQAHQSKSRSG